MWNTGRHSGLEDAGGTISLYIRVMDYPVVPVTNLRLMTISSSQPQSGKRLGLDGSKGR